MTFADNLLTQNRPDSIHKEVSLPRCQRCHPSPADWRDEVLYFLLEDRFSDGWERTHPLLDRSNLAAARPSLPNGGLWRWNRWVESGTGRWQGGTLQDIERYTRAGSGNLGGGGVDDLQAEHKRTDFLSLRDFNLSGTGKPGADLLFWPAI
jgi:hypothetical protein